VLAGLTEKVASMENARLCAEVEAQGHRARIVVRRARFLEVDLSTPNGIIPMPLAIVAGFTPLVRASAAT
jgi:hypothetical protein